MRGGWWQAVRLLFSIHPTEANHCAPCTRAFILKDSRLHSALTFPTVSGLSPPHARLRWEAGFVLPFVWQTKWEEAATCHGGVLVWLVGTSNLSVHQETLSQHVEASCSPH